MLERGDSRTLQVDVFGPEDGSPVLFVHGFVTGTAMTDAALALYGPVERAPTLEEIRKRLAA